MQSLSFLTNQIIHKMIFYKSNYKKNKMKSNLSKLKEIKTLKVNFFFYFFLFLTSNKLKSKKIIL